MDRIAYRVATLLILCLLPASAGARSSRVAEVPNGSVNGCLTCHTGNGGPRNSLGLAIENDFLDVPGFSGSVQWGAALAALDSDADGLTNGAELLDPEGTWSPGDADPGDAFRVVTHPGVAELDTTTFDALGGYTAYLANPENSDLFNVEAGVCDETTAFEHWRDTGFAEGRGFAEGELRTDNSDGSPDSDYEIDGGFSWEYPAANTVVFITANAPKPAGWYGRDLLLERCQTFNIGSYYTAEAYRTINVDVAVAIDGGQIPGFSSVTDHYVKYGFKEGRLTNSDWSQAELDAWVDADYFVFNGDVQTYFLGAQSEGWIAFGKIGFAHWINFGSYEGRNDGQPDRPTPFNLAQIKSGRRETAIRFLTEAGEGGDAESVNADAPPDFGSDYVTPFNTVLTPVGATPNINHFYSQLQAFSYDSLYLIVSEDIPGSPSARVVVRRVSDFGEMISSPVGEWGNPRWHPSDPSKLVHFDSNADDALLLQLTDVVTGETTPLFEFPPDYQRYLGNQSFDELSRDGRWIAGQAVGVGPWSRIFSFNLETASLGAELDPEALYAGPCTPDPEFGPVDPDWVGVSPLGNYLMVQWATSGTERCQGLESYDIQTGDYLGHVTAGHPHADLSVLADGITEVFVTNELTGPEMGQNWVNGEAATAFDSAYPALSYRELPGQPNGESAIHHLYLIDWGGFEHISCRGPYGYCVVTGYPSPENGDRDPLEDEIYLILLDGSGVFRLAHHHSSGADYWSQPKASLSADGRYVIFDSDWGLQDETLSYIIDLSQVPDVSP